jgi:glyoxylase-like metal-dependent hydrolase (beta-lactamase superfamily II)
MTRSPLLSAAAAAMLVPAAAILPARQAPAFERGVLPARWTADQQECAADPPFLVHEYNPTFIILRQSGCTNFEKPFLYLLLGSKQALLFDTGASGADTAAAVEEVLRRHSQPALPLLVVHSHGHGDHTAGDAGFKGTPGVRVIEARPDAVAQFFKIKNWPNETAEYDLGGRTVDIVAIPGHEPASIAIYDRKTAILLTGDTLYPGRLYVADAGAFTASIDRLAAFTAARDVAHVLGAHIENRRTPYLDYPQGTRFQPEEHALELGRAHLLELQDALRRMGAPLRRRALRDFTIWPLAQ